MTSDDIRELNVKLQDACIKTKTGDAQDVGLKSLECSLLAELTAQVADLNESVKKIDLTSRRWVVLHMADGSEQPFNRDNVVTLRSLGGEITVINDVFRQENFVRMPFKEVCAKLGIPVEG